MAGRYLLDHSNVCRAPNSYSGLDSSRREQEESISSHTKLILEPETFRPCSPLSFLLFLMFLYPPTIPFIFKCLLFAHSSPSVSACFHSNDVPRETQMELFISPLLSDIWEVFSTCSHGHAPRHTHTHCPPSWRQHTDATQPPSNPPNPKFIMPTLEAASTQTDGEAVKAWIPIRYTVSEHVL